MITPPAADPDAVVGVAALLEVARRPLIIAGGGAVGAADAIGALAERLQAPVLMTINGRGILPPAHPLGLSISAASAPALELMEEADLLLAVGTELGPTDFDESLKTRRHFGGKLIRVDIDPEQLMRSLLPAHGLAGDSRATVEALLGAIAPAERQGWGEAAVLKARQVLSHERQRRAFQGNLTMGAIQVDLPTIFVPAGPMLRGNYRGRMLGSGSDVWKYWAEKEAGRVTDNEWSEMERGIARSFGTCMTMSDARRSALSPVQPVRRSSARRSHSPGSTSRMHSSCRVQSELRWLLEISSTSRSRCPLSPPL